MGKKEDEEKDATWNKIAAMYEVSSKYCLGFIERKNNKEWIK